MGATPQRAQSFIAEETGIGVPEWALGVAAGNEEMMAQSRALALVTIS